jgi:hypothetical protein
MSAPTDPAGLAGLRGLRTAPALDSERRQNLRRELEQRMAACEWFTLGVMAPSASEAVRTLRACELAFGWSALEADGEADPAGPVFLKANQHTGRFLVRPESGLGEGVLVGGQSASDPAAADTWGPLPLDFFG